MRLINGLTCVFEELNTKQTFRGNTMTAFKQLTEGTGNPFSGLLLFFYFFLIAFGLCVQWSIYSRHSEYVDAAAHIQRLSGLYCKSL